MIKVAIIIINYNGNEDTIACLASLEKHTNSIPEIKYDIILVDNASINPLTNADLSGYKINIFYYKSSANLGFAGGNNFGISSYNNDGNNADYYLLLNNDTEIIDNSLDRLVMSSNSTSYAITGLVNYYYDNPSEVWQAGSMFMAYSLRSREVKPANKNVFVKVDDVPGSSMLIRKDIIDKIGLLDERFFAYYEEVEFCARARSKGAKIAFLDGTRILHKVGRSSTSAFKHYLRTRNTLLLYHIHYRHLMLIAFLRVFLRTLILSIHAADKKIYWRAMWRGIEDYCKKNFYLGSN